MAATRGQQIQDRCRCEVMRHHVLHQADREAGAKVRGSAELATRASLLNSDAQPSRGVLGTCLRVEAPHQPVSQEE